MAITGNILIQPRYYNRDKSDLPQSYPVSDDLMEGGVSLLIHYGMIGEMLDRLHSVAGELL